MKLKETLIKLYNKAKSTQIQEEIQGALLKVRDNMYDTVLMDEATKAKKGKWVYDIYSGHEYHDVIVEAVIKELKYTCEREDLQWRMQSINPFGIQPHTGFYVEWVSDE